MTVKLLKIGLFCYILICIVKKKLGNFHSADENKKVFFNRTPCSRWPGITALRILAISNYVLLVLCKIHTSKVVLIKFAIYHGMFHVLPQFMESYGFIERHSGILKSTKVPSSLIKG